MFRRTITLLPLLRGLSYAIALGVTPALAETVQDETLWCVHGDADQNIMQQQAPNRPYCAAALAGTLVTGTSLALGGIQRDWGQNAQRLACAGGNSSTAVGLIAACNCHNSAAVQNILGDPLTVITTLQDDAHCPHVP